MSSPALSPDRFIRRAALAGALSVIAFTAIHHLLINPIWNTLPAMLAAGALCGACIAWSFGHIAPARSRRGWYTYNALLVALFLALGGASMLAFEPMTTITALLAAKAPPTALIGRAFPFTLKFIFGAIGFFLLVYRPAWRGALSLSITLTLLVLVLGLNISILGLVSLRSGDVAVLSLTFGLLVVLAGTHAALVVAFDSTGTVRRF